MDKPRTLSDAIIATLTYSDHFSFPLSYQELHTRLIKLKVSQKQLKSTLKELLKNNKIEYSQDYYYLPGRKNLVNKRKTANKKSLELMYRAKRSANMLSKFPGVLAIFLTGSLSVGNSQGDDDIDLLIITKTNRLWTTRFIITLFTSLFSLRRTPYGKITTNKLCLNLYLTPKSLKLPQDKQNLYTAYELIQAVPLYDPLNTQSLLLSHNAWFRNYLPNYPLTNPNSSFPTLNIQYSIFLRLIEELAYRFQLWYMKGKMTSEYVNKNSAYFHPHNPGKSVLNKLNI